jgi:transcriptional regulator with XRE-family HTH domain
MTSAYESGIEPPILVQHRLRIAREYAGFEQEELAALIGVSRTTVGNAENGRVKPRKITLNAWALACGVPVSWIEKGGRSSPPDDGGQVSDKKRKPPKHTDNQDDQPSGGSERPSYAAAA